MSNSKIRKFEIFKFHFGSEYNWNRDAISPSFLYQYDPQDVYKLNIVDLPPPSRLNMVKNAFFPEDPCFFLKLHCF